MGSRLPSCRQLASELGINRNTANKVLQDLVGDGLVKAIRGHGFVVVALRPETVVPGPGMREHILTACQEARLSGFAREDFLRAVAEIADGVYADAQPAIAFVECNQEDADAMSRDIAAALSIRVQPMLLSALEHDPEEISELYPIICTPLNHLPEVRQLMAGTEAQLLSVHAVLHREALEEIAQLPAQTRLGIVCALPITEQYMTGVLGMVHRGPMQSCLSADTEALAEMRQSCDVIVDVSSCHKETVAIVKDKPIITVRFRIDPESIEPLRERIVNIAKGEAQDQASARSTRAS